MNLISASYNMYHNSIDITFFDSYILRIDCNKAEEGLKTTAWTDHVLNAMAIDNPLEYARLYLNNEMLVIFTLLCFEHFHRMKYCSNPT